MRTLIVALLLLLNHSAWAARCIEIAQTLNHHLGQKIDTTELADILDSLNKTHHLPAKFVSKKLAKAAGWKPGGDLWYVLPGKSIGGDRFGNYEESLPASQYIEADLDYRGGRRGAKRIVFNHLQRFITVDHYRTFYEVPSCQ